MVRYDPREHDGRGRRRRKKKPLDLIELFGLAVGCAGVAPSEFWECTPDEAAAIIKAWQDAEEARERGAWERMRTLAAIAVQPHCKQRLTPRNLVPLPWDKTTGRAKAPKRSKAERLAEWERLKRMV